MQSCFIKIYCFLKYWTIFWSFYYDKDSTLEQGVSSQNSTLMSIHGQSGQKSRRANPPSLKLFIYKARESRLQQTFVCLCIPRWLDLLGILTLLTWIPQNRLGKLHLSLRSARKHSTKVNRAFSPARSFSIVNPMSRQLKARLYRSELSYRTVVLKKKKKKCRKRPTIDPLALV